MSEEQKPDLEERVARLEVLVERLLARNGPEKAFPQPDEWKSSPRRRPIQRKEPVADPSGAFRPEPEPPGDGFRGMGEDLKKWLTLLAQSERWLGRIGIGFVILAVAFLLKLSFDRGWITPELRMGAGFAAGATLLILGLRVDPLRRGLEQALLGGAVAVFYLTGFAGFQLYGLLPFWVALSVMSTTTVLSIALSERQDSPLLAMVGIMGGLATPFLLNTGSGDVNALAVYSSIVLVGGGAVQFHRGWIPLLGTLLVGGSVVLSLVALGAGEGETFWPALAVASFWLVCGASVILQPVLRPDPSRSRNFDSYLWAFRVGLGVSTGLAVLFLSMILDLQDQGASGLLFLFGIVLAGSAYYNRGVALSQRPAAEVSALSMAMGCVLLAPDSTALLLVMAEVAVLFLLVARGAPRSLSALGNLFAAMVGIGFLSLAGTAPLDGALGFREEAFARLGIVAMLGLVSLWTEKEGAQFYRAAAYVGLLVWFLSELGTRPNGTQMVSIAWSLQGATALVWSLRIDSQKLQLVGLGTLGLVAGKLLLVDLAQMDPFWRILMFLGFGVGLLSLAYVVRRPTRVKEERGMESGTD
jgi:uncharacterized membrane protein